MPYKDAESRRRGRERWLASKTPEELATMRERRLATSADYKTRNREIIRAKGRAYQAATRDANKEVKRQRSRDWWKNNPDYNYMRKYGITRAQRDEMFAKQGSACATCDSPIPGFKHGWHTDHCHKTGKVRGILCQRCNLTLGKIDDDAQLLRRMADYIEQSHAPDTRQR